MRALIYYGSVALSFLIVILNHLLIKFMFRSFVLDIMSLMWVSFFYSFYFFILTDWYLNTNYQKIDRETQTNLFALQNLIWYSLPKLCMTWLLSLVKFNRDFYIYYDAVSDVREEVIRRTLKLFNKLKRLFKKGK